MPVVYMKTWHHDLLVINLMDYVKGQKLWERAKSILSFFVSRHISLCKICQNTDYPRPVFSLSPYLGKCGSEKNDIQAYLTQCFSYSSHGYYMLSALF